MKQSKLINLLFIILMLALTTILFAQLPIPEVTPDIPEEEMTAYKFATPPTIDGDLTDWIEAGAIFKFLGTDDHILRGFDTWWGPEDRSLTWSMMWDENYIYFAAARYDDYLTMAPDSTAGWKGDCTFLYIDIDEDLTSDNNAQAMYFPEDVPKIMSLGNTEVSDSRIGFPGGMIEMPMDERLGEAGCFIEFAIPTKYYPDIVFAVGSGFACNIGEEEGNQEPDGGKFLIWKNEDGDEPISDNMHIIQFGDVVDTAVESPISNIPTDFALDNYPNPFNPTTTIQYSLSQNSMVNLAVYNQNGQLVDMLVDQEMSAGTHEVAWNASHMPSGLYFYTMTTENRALTRKMLLIK